MRQLSPSYFALVMATGIISIAARDFGLPALSIGLLVFNLLAYVLLVAFSLLRAARYPRLFLAEMTDHLIGTSFFAPVAASSILGVQLLLIVHSLTAAGVLLALAVCLWISLTYTIFTAFTVKREKPALEHGLSGAWLIAVVATQSVAVLAALIARERGRPYQLELNFFALSMWLWGGMFYIWIISLIFYRYTFFAFSPGDLTPPYWINMGAMAISALAGARLVENLPHAPFLASLLPFLKGLTVFFWATGTWWIPMLLVLGVWRHGIRRFPLRYDPLYWGAVFPLGMYSVATKEMARALGLPFLAPLTRAMFVAALIAWVLTFAGMAWELTRIVLPRRADP
ncbi:MAG: tellurite resistance/C4-dicarboxylate transporter family protein [Acetobacteraceae bacterium]